MFISEDLAIVEAPFQIGGTLYTSDEIMAMSDASLAALGLYRLVDDTVVDPTLIATGSTIQKFDDGTYHRVYTTAARPVVVGLAPTVLLPIPASTQVDNERDRRMYGGVIFNGVVYQTNQVALTNILGSMQMATLAISQGAKAGNLRWADPTNDFYWIATDNSKNLMDAQTVIAFALVVAAFRTKCTYTARGIKDALAGGATLDITADATWGMAAYGAALPASS